MVGSEDIMLNKIIPSMLCSGSKRGHNLLEALRSCIGMEGEAPNIGARSDGCRPSGPTGADISILTQFRIEPLNQQSDESRSEPST